MAGRIYFKCTFVMSEKSGAARFRGRDSRKTVPKQEAMWNWRGRNHTHDFGREQRVIRMIEDFSGPRGGSNFEELLEASSSREVALWAVESTAFEREYVVSVARNVIQQRLPIPERAGLDFDGIPEECCEDPINFEYLVDGWRQGLIAER